MSRDRSRSRSFQSFCVRACVAASLVGPLCAGTVSLTSGIPGTTLNSQSFNETRSADVSILSGDDLAVESMTLHGLSIGAASSANVGARIYVSGSGLLVASANVTTTANGSVTVPITANLVSGGNYRLAFHVATTPANQGSGNLFDPSPSGSGGFPYSDTSGLILVNGGFQLGADAYPTTPSFSTIPQISLEIDLPIDLTSGTAGSFTPVPQSFNETRGVDVTVLDAEDLRVTAMTLQGLFLGGASSAVVGARIYASGSGALVATANANVTVGGTVTVPISAILASGLAYRVSFHVATSPANQGSGTMFDPAPSGSGGFPYVESLGSLRVNSAHSIAADAYPTNANIFVPLITLTLGSSTGTTFCVGDGSGTSCPCANHSPTGQRRGCLNSFAIGALHTATGMASVSADTVTLRLAGASPTGQFATFFQGTAQSSGGAGVAFGDGLRCAVGTTLRLGSRLAVGGAVDFGFGIPGDPLVHVQGAVSGAAIRHYQVLYRNAAAFCTSATFNTSNGLTIAWIP